MTTTKLRLDKLNERMEAAGMKHQKDLAAAMRMSEPAISRALNYGRFGRKFVDNLLAAFPDSAYEDLFERAEAVAA
ncbi:hypothetical protein GS474_15905 [Rhodococcus hoagii]|nr:hypothetical protein [Prescottella equi]NKR60215.1 hypothetical protein [Prescottella equi]